MLFGELRKMLLKYQPANSDDTDPLLLPTPSKLLTILQTMKGSPFVHNHCYYSSPPKLKADCPG